MSQLETENGYYLQENSLESRSEIDWAGRFGGIKIPEEIAREWMDSSYQANDGTLVIPRSTLFPVMPILEKSRTYDSSYLRPNDRKYNKSDLNDPNLTIGRGDKNFYSLAAAAAFLDNARYPLRGDSIVRPDVLEAFEGISNPIWITRPLEGELSPSLQLWSFELPNYYLKTPHSISVVPYKKVSDLQVIYKGKNARVMVTNNLKHNRYSFEQRGYLESGDSLVDAQGEKLGLNELKATYLVQPVFEYFLRALEIDGKLDIALEAQRLRLAEEETLARSQLKITAMIQMWQEYAREQLLESNGEQNSKGVRSSSILELISNEENDEHLSTGDLITFIMESLSLSQTDILVDSHQVTIDPLIKLEKIDEILYRLYERDLLDKVRLEVQVRQWQAEKRLKRKASVKSKISSWHASEPIKMVMPKIPKKRKKKQAKK